jgi:peptidoglycan/LPS O-acetylase OafA/YrhL
MISGFYMALVLNGRYGTGSYSLFITNRPLRLFPVYWVLVIPTFAVSVATYFAIGTPLKFEAY